MLTVATAAAGLLYRKHLNDTLAVQLDLASGALYSDGSVRDPTVMARLIERGASPNGAGQSRLTPLMWAAAAGDLNLIRRLVARGARVNPSSFDQTPLMWAVTGSPEASPAAVELLIRSGAEVNARTERGHTALHLAAQDGTTEVVECLLRHGARIEAVDSHRITPLMLAVGGNRTANVRLLLERGARPEMRDYRGRAALMWAARGGRVGAARELLRRRADPRLRDSSGATPLKLAGEGRARARKQGRREADADYVRIIALLERWEARARGPRHQ